MVLFLRDLGIKVCRYIIGRERIFTKPPVNWRLRKKNIVERRGANTCEMEKLKR